MKIKPIVFSISGAIIISLFFTFSLFGIFYEYAGSLNSVKDAINTLGGYFGGIATLWAAVIAAYLFNDWREQHNKSIQRDLITNIVNSFSKADFKLAQFFEAFTFFQLDIMDIHNLSDQEFNNLNTLLQDVITCLKGVSLELSGYEEDIRKYSLLFNTNDIEQIKPHLQKIHSTILNIQRHKIKLPASIEDIQNLSSTLKDELKDLDSSVNDKLLSKIKAQ